MPLYRSYPSTLIANQSEEWTLHDTNELDPNVGFIPDATGNFEGRLRGDTADTTFNVAADTFYPFDIRLAKSTSATGVTKIQVFRWTPNPQGS